MDKLFCHEVPLLRTFEDFPDREKKFLNLHTIFKEKGVGPAMFAFVQAISAGEDAGNFQETAAVAGGRRVRPSGAQPMNKKITDAEYQRRLSEIS